MKFIQQALCVAALSTVAAVSYSGSAQAISFKMSTGVAGPSSVTDQGAFSEFYKLKGTTTIDFNSGKAPTTGFAKYTFENGNRSSVRADQWAPAGANGERNMSNYLAVFDGDKVTIELAKTLNYFGIDWGAISGGNIFSFYNGNKLVQSFSTADVNPVAPVKAAWQGGEGNGYVHFYSTSTADTFNRIVISQQGGGGFESDNHSFHVGNGAFNPESVPEPSVVLGLAAAGGTLLIKRKRKKHSEV